MRNASQLVFFLFGEAGSAPYVLSRFQLLSFPLDRTSQLWGGFFSVFFFFCFFFFFVPLGRSLFLCAPLCSVQYQPDFRDSISACNPCLFCVVPLIAPPPLSWQRSLYPPAFFFFSFFFVWNLPFVEVSPENVLASRLFFFLPAQRCFWYAIPGQRVFGIYALLLDIFY